MKTSSFFAIVCSLMAASATVTGCSGAKLLDWATPQTGYVRQTDIAYGDQPRQTLDVYKPIKPDATHSVIVFFYGGSWQTGDKAMYRFVGQSLASQGYVTVIANYRLYPDAYFPTYTDDAAQAFVWVHQHIVDYGGNANHMYLLGHSAGAHLAMLLALDDHYLQQAGGRKQWIKGVIGLAGPYDFLPLTDPKLKELFSKVPLAQTQPINFVQSHEPPILLLHGDADTSVDPQNSFNLAAKLRQHGNSVVYKLYPRLDHVGILQALSVRFPDKAPVVPAIVDFIQATNRSKASVQ